jgi:hypothetical protein
MKVHKGVFDGDAILEVKIEVVELFSTLLDDRASHKDLAI